ncbi:MAG TPA: copper homeostasis protein CutC, partial [Saprospiraceae bacterium]|nr:copper homeostasis protein CutC [Saprospiraceae bacterium]
VPPPLLPFLLGNLQQVLIMKAVQIEVCAGHIRSALAAQQAGADRIELCSALDSGGLTPSAGLIREAVLSLSIPVHVLIRPREGDFVYDEDELRLMCHDISLCRSLGAAGVVIGALDEQGGLHAPAMQQMADAAAGLHITCHRAFDSVPDPAAALEQLIGWGVGRVLSSGQAATAYEGRFLLKKCVEQAAGRIAIMAGAGISPQNIGAVRAETGVADLHLSGRRRVSPVWAGQRIAGLEWDYWQSDESVLREAIAAVKEGNRRAE